jgi:hypothetical protein
MMDSVPSPRIERVGRRVAAWQLLLVDAVLLIVAGVLLVTVFSAFVPYNMDEFIHYNTLICHLFPLIDIGDNACHSLDLLLPGTQWLAPLRAFHYSGSAPATYYLPLLLLWQDPLSARFLGLLFLFFEAVLLARVMRTRVWLPLLLLLTFFPYAFQHIVDTGPVGFHLFSIFALYALCGQWARTLHPRYMVFAALLVAFCVWIKFSYFWLLPGIGILWAVQVVRHKTWTLGRCSEILLQPLAALALALVPLVILISSVNPKNPSQQPYLDQLRRSDAYTFSEMFTIDWERTSIGQAFLRPLEASQRIFLVSRMPEELDRAYRSLVYLFVPVFALLLAIAAFWHGNRGLWIPTALYVAFVSAVVMIARTKASAAMHHAILAFPFLVLAVGETVRLLRDRSGRWGIVLRVVAIAWCMLFLGLSGVYWSVMPRQAMHLTSDVSKDRLFRVLNDPEVANRYVIVVVDWGAYYIQGLYGHSDQILLWRWHVSPEELRKLRILADAKGRKLLFMHSQPESEADIPMLRTVGSESCMAVPPDARWQLIGEPDPVFASACRRVARIGR